MANSMLRLRRNLIVSTGLAAISACLPQLAHADAAAAAASAHEVDQVVVTAERRSVDIQRAPLAVTAVNGATLDQSGTTAIAGLNGVVPSLEITKASGFENLVTIRGVGSERKSVV